MNTYYYLVITRVTGPVNYGPFLSEAERNEFACALWFMKPARLPGTLRGQRIAFNAMKEGIFYCSVTNNRMSSFRNVTVGELASAKNFPKG